MGRNDKLTDQALEKIHNIQKIGQNVKAHRDLNEVKTQLSTAEKYLNAIRHIGALQDHDFSTEIKAAIEVLQNCETLFSELSDSSMQDIRIILKPMQGRLDKMLQQISLRVLETPVGVKDGVFVEPSVLNYTNAEVEPIFKKSLVIMDFLKKEGIVVGKGKLFSIATYKTLKACGT
jgi:DNA-binding transcriptional regulator YiaG